MKKVSVKTLTNTLFLRKSQAYAIDFAEKFDGEEDAGSLPWHAEVVHVAGSAVAVIAHKGSGDAFTYDITYERNADQLYRSLKKHRFHKELPGEIWIDETSVVAVSFTKAKECPAALAVENGRMSDLLLFISDEFDRSHCHHTEIEEKLDAFFSD